jgi:hypothetical protein
MNQKAIQLLIGAYAHATNTKLTQDQINSIARGFLIALNNDCDTRDSAAKWISDAYYKNARNPKIIPVGYFADLYLASLKMFRYNR